MTMSWVDCHSYTSATCTVFSQINTATFICAEVRRLFEGGVYLRAAFISLATRFVSNSDFLDAPIKRAYSTIFSIS